MADKKISELTSATTPLAGTEILPIVQGGNTVKVTIDNLTTGKAVSAGNLTVTGTLTGSTGILNIGSGQIYKDAQGNTAIGTTAPEGLFNVTGGASPNARQLTVGYGSTSQNYYTANTHTWLSGSYSTTMALNSTSLTLTSRNLVLGTAGNGIDFSANTNAAGMTSELLTWYEEGTATAVLTDGTNNATLAAGSGMIYTRIGRMVMVQGYIEVSNIGSVSGPLRLSGLPFNVNSSSRSSFSVGQVGGLAITAGQSMTGFGQANTNYIRLYVWTATTGSTEMTNTQLSTGGFLSFSFNYAVA